jgi:oxygen-dependent protoporphyrinogen oxidase
LSDNRVIGSQTIVLAVPSYAAAALLQTLSPESARGLSEIQYAPLGIVHVGVPEREIADKRSGFGFLAVRNLGV